MSQSQPNNPLHGVTLKTIVTKLHQHFGWQALAEHIPVNCFKSNPSINSSLKFLRKTDWARTKVENLYIKTFLRAGKGASKSATKVTPAQGDAWDKYRR